ncbi:hypothetical protein G9A89_009802 [Geosiphon pyriformis]|nr:hypothetical protein G9A89_009802 [Geosiphon pyriformis]
MYAQTRCTVVCFNSAELLNAAVKTTPVLRNTNLHWSCLISAKCAKCEKLGHTSLDCVVGGNQKVLVDNGSFLEMKPSLLVMMKVNNRFAALERNLVCLAEQVGKLAKRLNALRPMVPQPSPGCQPLVTPSSQDQRANVVTSGGSGVSTSGGTVVGVVSFNMSSVSKLEDSMRCLMKTVLGLLAKVDNIGACSVSLPLTQ